MLNRVTLMGRLTRDPDLRRTQSGVSVCSFSIAADRDYKGQDGEKTTDYFDIVAWRSTAEFVCKYFSKGRMIVVDGQLQTRRWTDKNGANRTSVEVLADSCYFGDSKRDGDAGGSYAASSYAAPAGSYAPAGGGFLEIEEDGELPF